MDLKVVITKNNLIFKAYSTKNNTNANVNIKVENTIA